MEPNLPDEAIKDQGALNTHHSYTDRDFEGHRAHSFYVGLLNDNHKHHGHHRRHRHHHKHHHKENGKDDNRPATPPSQRVQFILGEVDDDDAHESHPLFTEMEELFSENGDMEWRETARWVKFEEDVEEGGNRWSKPHVATLSLHSLFELRSCILNGTVMLDMEATSLEQISDLVIDNMINQKQMNEEHRDKLKDLLLRRHRHQHEKRHDNNKGSRIPLIRSLADIGRVHSSSKTYAVSDGGLSVPQTPVSPGFPGSGGGPPHFGPFHFGPQQQADSSANGHGDGLPQSPSNHSLHHNQSGGHLNSGDGISTSASTNEIQTLKSNAHFMKKIPPGSETSNILVGEVEFLDRPISAFVRLSQAVILGDLTEVPVPTRFIFFILGPQGNIGRYHEIGRAIATLMSDDVFHDVAYKGRSRLDLIAGVDEFLDAVTVLPPGEWDPSIRIEPPQKIPSQDHRKTADHGKEEVDECVEEEKERQESGLKRTGRLFGGLMNDVKRKLPWYLSDFKDAFALQCLASFIFLYFACLTPIITFGGLLGQATEDRIAAIESMVAGCVCGILYALFSGQPLTILSSTGPVLVFETIAYSFCHDNGLEYLSFRVWIGCWTGFVLLVLVAVDASAFVCYITRFTEENFACLISLIFIYKAFENMYEILHKYPIDRHPEETLLADHSCNCSYPDNYTTSLYNWTDVDKLNCTMSNGTLIGGGCSGHEPVPDIFLMSFMLFLLTFLLSFGLKEIKNSSFFPAKAREVLNDFAVTIAILSMVFLDYMVGLGTPKLLVPTDFKPTWSGRGWVIPPFGNNPWWTSIAAIIPAMLATILIFMDQQISAVIVNRKEHKLRKGGGYHLDLFVLALLIILCSIMGLPWFVAGTVLSVNHVNSLRMESETAAPGEKPQFLGVREQRLTHLMIFIMIGCSVLLTPVLQLIPMPVLYGVFLYMGVSSLNGLQFIDRILIVFMPAKYQPDYTFLRQVPLNRVHIFTVIQLACLIGLWVIKSFKETSILFPLMLVVLILVRKLLDFLFTQRELKILDDVMPESTKRKREEERRKSQQFEGVRLICQQSAAFAFGMPELMKGEDGDECQGEGGIKIGPSGNLQIPLANGNIMKIPVDKMHYDPEINISEEVAKTGIWKQVNNKSKSEDKSNHKSKSKKKRGTKKDALNDEERKRLSTMAEEDDEEDGPISIRVDSAHSQVEAKMNNANNAKKSSGEARAASPVANATATAAATTPAAPTVVTTVPVNSTTTPAAAAAAANHNETSDQVV